SEKGPRRPLLLCACRQDCDGFVSGFHVSLLCIAHAFKRGHGRGIRGQRRGHDFFEQMGDGARVSHQAPRRYPYLAFDIQSPALSLRRVALTLIRHGVQYAYSRLSYRASVVVRCRDAEAKQMAALPCGLLKWPCPGLAPEQPVRLLWRALAVGLQISAPVISNAIEPGWRDRGG